MTWILGRSGGIFDDIKFLLSEARLPSIDEASDAALRELPSRA